ncbi:MAG: 3-deoxy-manno-octulosonate cytidylyltransferase [Rhodospirillaceae bacterium]
MKNLCVIPARMGSSRFPGKPLEKLLGLELVLHVYERCRLASNLDRTVIATCDGVIRDACERHGAEVVMTRDDHPGAVDRTAEAVEIVGGELADDDFVLMVQGDELLVAPDMIDPVVDAFAASRAPVVNLASPILDAASHDDPNVVKVACALDGKALFFSRSPIPSRTRVAMPTMLQQTGVIGFSKRFLATFLALERTPLEMTEGIDMLRTLEHGYAIQMVAAARPTLGVDTPDQIGKGEALLRGDPITRLYMESAA